MRLDHEELLVPFANLINTSLSQMFSLILWNVQQAFTLANGDRDKCLHMVSLGHKGLTQWGWMTHIYASKLTIIGSDNDLTPVGAKPLSEPMLEYC